MKQVVCYLYEYETNHQVRNVGFVKCQQNDNQVVFQIHGKGLSCTKGERYEMNLFRGEDEVCYISRAGHVDTEQSRINYIVTVDGVDETVFSNYDGLYIHVGGMKRYVAMWTQKRAVFDAVESYAKYGVSQEVAVSVENKAHVKVEENQDYQETKEYEIEQDDECHGTCEEICHTVCQEECEPGDYVCMEECQEMCGCEEHVMEAEECCYDAIRRRKEEEKRRREEEPKDLAERHPHRPVAPLEPEHDHDDDRHCHHQHHEEVRRKEDKNSNQITYEKIERQDIAKLPQREWRLANNSFLLHGYHNYQHILFIQEAGRSFIGVPGIYSPREADAAKSFGFPVFHRIDKGAFEWDDCECEKEADFGYWCKEVGYRG